MAESIPGERWPDEVRQVNAREVTFIDPDRGDRIESATREIGYVTRQNADTESSLPTRRATSSRQVSSFHYHTVSSIVRFSEAIRLVILSTSQQEGRSPMRYTLSDMMGFTRYAVGISDIGIR